jgi:hypothetical protein
VNVASRKLSVAPLARILIRRAEVEWKANSSSQVSSFKHPGEYSLLHPNQSLLGFQLPSPHACSFVRSGSESTTKRHGASKTRPSNQSCRGGMEPPRPGLPLSRAEEAALKASFNTQVPDTPTMATRAATAASPLPSMTNPRRRQSPRCRFAPPRKSLWLPQRPQPRSR